MRVGVSLRSSFPVEDPRLGARWMIERAAAASAAGLDSLFVGDHHATGPSAYYQNSAILGRLLAEWDTTPRPAVAAGPGLAPGPRPAGALYLLALWNPVLAAEQIGTLAALCRGRFILQCAIGGGEAQFSALGAELRTRPSVFEHRLGVVRALLAGAEVDGVRIAPVPPEPPEVWIGGGAPAAIERAARLGDGWIAGPELTDERAAAQAGAYVDACARHGREPNVVAIRRDVHIGADDADAGRVAEPVLQRGYRGFHPDATVVGGPDAVAERFARYRAAGFTDVIVRHLADRQEDVLVSFARLGDVRLRLVPDAAPLEA